MLWKIMSIFNIGKVFYVFFITFPPHLMNLLNFKL